jgi:hypothetical protein
LKRRTIYPNRLFSRLKYFRKLIEGKTEALLKISGKLPSQAQKCKTQEGMFGPTEFSKAKYKKKVFGKWETRKTKCISGNELLDRTGGTSLLPEGAKGFLEALFGRQQVEGKSKLGKSKV